MQAGTETEASPEAAAVGSPAIAASGDRRWVSYLPAAAGVGYLVAWIAGLAAWPANLGLDATGAQIAATYRAHAAQAATQYLLVEGLAGVLLAVVLGALMVTRRTSGWSVSARPAAWLGAIAALTSVAQCLLGLLIVGAADGSDMARCANLFALVNRLDGVKMLALAGAAAYLAAGRAREFPLPRWLRLVGWLLAAAMIGSGVSFLALTGSAAWTAYLSGPLLLLWVSGIGIWLTVRRS